MSRTLFAAIAFFICCAIPFAQDSVRPQPVGKGNTASGDTIRLGLVASLNGALMPWGIEALRGAQIAVDQINAAGGVNGKRIELIVGDDGSRPEMAKMAAEKLVKQRVVAMVGDIASGLSAQMAQSCNESGVPQLVNGGTRPDLTEFSANMFRICYQDNDQAVAMARFAYERLGLHRLAIMEDIKLPYSVGLADRFSEEFTKLGGDIAITARYESGDVDFISQIKEIAKAHPDGIYHTGYFPEAGPFMRQLRQKNIKLPVLGCDGWDSRDIFITSGGNVDGTYITNHMGLHQPGQTLADFNNEYKKRFGSEPQTFAAAMTYDAFRVLANAVSRCKEVNSVGITKAIGATKDYLGITGRVSIDPATGNAIRRVAILKLTKSNSEFVEAILP